MRVPAIPSPLQEQSRARVALETPREHERRGGLLQGRPGGTREERRPEEQAIEEQKVAPQVVRPVSRPRGRGRARRLSGRGQQRQERRRNGPVGRDRLPEFRFEVRTAIRPEAGTKCDDVFRSHFRTIEKVPGISHLDQEILRIVGQHLENIGLVTTAEMLTKEAGIQLSKFTTS
jgi:hypothetical protein